ncbi:hypothetical protein CC78DRAFT_487099 [Lojkania enalia]|uniref:Membrane insertase YidC/Oxa/ALB C-terminal domain-containing protein n=1 Tax=Lojkania enalia TaxID=147567 RepID=A0A9P4NA97_9PLEO|nr:hypothetical protein CC78DRAFT_487099 [Didymosphaeria enalia]
MVLSRGLRYAHSAPFSSRQSLLIRSATSREFSSLPRTSILHAPSCRSNTFQSSQWRTGATSFSPTLLKTSTIRHGSWYAPWTWGRSSTPTSDTSSISSPSELLTEGRTAPDPAITTQTPGLAPATLDHPAIVDSASAVPSQSNLDELLSLYGPQNHAPDATSAAASQVVEKIGFLKELGLDYGWGPTAFLEYMIEHIHIWGGVSWGTTIIAAALVIRAIGFPLSIKASDNMARMTAVAGITRPLYEEMKRASAARDMATAQKLQAKITHTHKEAECGPFKSVLPMLFQGALGFGAFRCLRGMADLPVESMRDQGFLWFTDLTISDPYYILPVLVGATSYILLKIGGETGGAANAGVTAMQRGVRIFMPLMFMTVSIWMPAGLQLYFLLSSTLGAMTGRLLQNPSVRQTLNITPIATKQAQDFWKKVADKQISLESLARDKNGNIIPPTVHTATYQPPHTAGKTTFRGLTLKAGTSVPAHLQTHDTAATPRDPLFDAGPPEGIKNQVLWYVRYYNPLALGKRFWVSLWPTAKADRDARILQSRKEAQRQKEKEYESRRRERLGRK